MKSELTGKYFLSAGDVNAQGELSLSLLTAKIIDIATLHANSLGIGNPAMKSLGYGWVLSRIAIEMMQYPKVNEEYSVTTWIESWNRHFSVRNFEVTDSKGNICGYARSVWMVLNWNTRENAGLSHLHLDPSMINGTSVPIERIGKHRLIIEPEEPMHNGALVANAPAKFYTFGYSDLDFYRHVNTVKYVSMILNCFSLDQMDHTRVQRLEMCFMREGRYGENVRLSRHDDEDQTSFALCDTAEGTPLLSAFLLRRATAFS